MRIKKILFISVLFFMVALSIGAISAQDADGAVASGSNSVALGESQSVSGGVDVVTENPWNTNGELSYDIPSDAKSIRSADVYVNVYSGSAANNYGANANITINTANGDIRYFESLWSEEGSTDGTVYTVNDHTTKCYSDYMIHYDVTDMLNDLNGTNLKIDVNTFKMDGKQFDGRIKLIALVLAYDDGNVDSISYWIKAGQLWSRSNVEITFDTDDVNSLTGATLTNVVLSSGDGTYRFNDEFLGDAETHVSGNYYQFNQWDVTEAVKENQKNTLNVYVGSSAFGSIKNVLSVLTVSRMATDISLSPEYSNVPSAYAGTNNTLTVKVKTSKAGDYAVRLFADGAEVDGAEVALAKGETTILLTDPTIRAVDASTVNGAKNNQVIYMAELSYNGSVINSKEISIPVLYNGNLGHDFEYNVTGFEAAVPIAVTGDVVVDIKDAGSNLDSSSMGRTDVWQVNLEDGSKVANAFVYVPYNWFNAKTYVEGTDMFTATFNGASVTPVAWYRDQGNLGNYGKYGYGVLVYDVSDLIAAGDNSFVLNKINPTPAVYPSALVYLCNSTSSPVSRTVYILNGADLLSNSNNDAGRIVKVDTVISADSSNADYATLYILAAGAQAGESDIVFNGKVYGDVWNGTSSTTNLFTADITGLVKDSNSISFVATGSTILALPQIIVISQDHSTILSAEDVVVYKDCDGELVATLTTAKGKAIANAAIFVNLGGVDYPLKTNSKGQVKVSTKGLDIGNYIATISYPGNKEFNPSNTTANVVVTKEDMTISAVYDEANSKIVATLTNKDTGKVVANVNVKVNLNGETNTVKSNSKGQVIVSTANCTSGTAKFSYAGNSKYNPASTTIKFSSKNDVVISAVYDAANSEIVATLISDATGKAIANANVKVTFNGETNTLKTNTKGQVKISTVGLPVGTYHATFSYAGNSKYNAASASINVEVKTRVIVTDVYAYSDRIVAKLTNGATGKTIANANMIVEINGVKYDAKSDNKGQLTFYTAGFNLPSAYDLTISYRGNNRYTASSATVAVDLNKANMMITTNYHADKQKMVATLKNSKTGKIVSKANMIIDLNGVKTTYKSNDQGKITLPTADFAPGTYVGTVTYPGNARYNSISAVFK